MTRRIQWVAKLKKLSGSFGTDAGNVVTQLQAEVASEGILAIYDHLQTCGAIPEDYAHDSSEEKLYSKYTDAVLSEAFRSVGLSSAVIELRSNSADVQARSETFSLVADAKAFRLSRTAKNQKDFKIQALDGWRAGLDFALLVGPIYQFPTKRSQIYLQAISRNVCILSFSHLAALVGLSHRRGAERGTTALRAILVALSALHPSQDAVDYWTAINRVLVDELGPDV